MFLIIAHGIFQILRRIHSLRSRRNKTYLHTYAVFQQAELFQFFRFFQRTRRKLRHFFQGFARKRIHAHVPHIRSPAHAVAGKRNGLTGKIQSLPALGKGNLHLIRRSYALFVFFFVQNNAERGAFAACGMEGVQQGCYHCFGDKRLVALNIGNDGLFVESQNIYGFAHPVGAALVFARVHKGNAKFRRRFFNAFIISCQPNIFKNISLHGAHIHVPKKRPAADKDKRFARKTR